MHKLPNLTQEQIAQGASTSLETITCVVKNLFIQIKQVKTPPGPAAFAEFY